MHSDHRCLICLNCVTVITTQQRMLQHVKAEWLLKVQGASASVLSMARANGRGHE